MLRFLIILCFTCLPLLAHAWNATGHRLIAAIAWQQLTPQSRQQIVELLAEHPDYPHWREKAKTDAAGDIFIEAATWADEIRHDPRFYDEKHEAPTPAIAGLFDNARHKTWHYIDLADNGEVQAGELAPQIERLSQMLRRPASRQQRVWALPWLMHLVGDIHQPLHVGRHRDEGGNKVEIENPFNPRQPFSNLHAYWDDLPGRAGLRGKRLSSLAGELLAGNPAPVQGSVRGWRDESRELLATAYPSADGSLLPIINEEFRQRTSAIAERRVVAAGYRLGRLLNSIFTQRIARETS